MLLIIVLVLLVVLIVAVVGIGALLVLKKNSGGESHDAPPAHAEPAAAQPAPPSAVDLTKPPIFALLDPFTVNLRAERGDDGRYLQAVIALRVPDQLTADRLKGFMPEIRHRINMLLAARTAFDVQEVDGRETLARDIQIQINTLLGFPPPPPNSPTLSNGPIQAVLFNSFIIQ
jgi:flagellar FliL protein